MADSTKLQPESVELIDSSNGKEKSSKHEVFESWRFQIYICRLNCLLVVIFNCVVCNSGFLITLYTAKFTGVLTTCSQCLKLSGRKFLRKLELPIRKFQTARQASFSVQANRTI